MTTTENSRADALTEAQRRTLQSALDLFVAMGHAPGSDHVRTLAGMLAKPSSSQPAAAPMPPNAQLRRVMDLLDAHLGDSDPTLEGMTQEEIEEEFPVVAAMQIIVGLYQDPPTASDTAPSPADERAALSDQDIYDKFSFLEGLVNESTYVRIADTAIEIARAASANETGAEGADEPSELEQVIACLGDDAATLRHADEYVEMADNMDAAARLLESRHGEILQKIGSALGLLAGDDLHRHVLPALHAVLLDAKRWRAFRSRDAFENLEYVVFQDQFREDADRIIDAAIAESDEYRAAEEMCNWWPWEHASALAGAEPPTHIVDAVMDVARHEYGHGVTRSSIVAIWKALGKPWYALAEGYAVVPLEPTEEMKLAGLRADDRDRQPRDQLLVQWDAMLAAAPQPAQADARQTDDEWWNQALRERDIYEEYADEMASAIANHLHIEIGEHSNFNNPWLKALEAIKNARQAAARVGLTADMRVAIQECIEYLKPAAKDFADLDMGDSKHARCIRTLRALLATPLPEPRAEVTDCGCATNEACKMKTDGSCWRAD